MIELCSYLYFQIFFTFLTVWFISKTGERENKSHFLQMALQVNLIDLLNILIEHHKANILRSDNMAPKTHKKSNPGLRSSRGLREHRQPLRYYATVLSPGYILPAAGINFSALH